MDIQGFIERLPREYYAWGSIAAHPRDPLRYVEVLDAVDHMTTPATMHLLNLAVQYLEHDECYLEVGTWRGATLIGALLGNRARGYAIDDSSMTEFDHDGRASNEVWREAMARAGLTRRATYIDGAVPAVWARVTVPPIGVYFFDGDKSTTEPAYEGLMSAVPHLARHALIICDDANTPQIREAAFWFCHQYHDRAVKILELPTPGNTWPCFWNGLLVIAWGALVER